mmetsp:Transcript_7820/g.23250  ORF Transcript_7820/g.23250 Transcript_7820/m.23250 type:complete len:634 (-) Transcript_7820:108-2009(-)
MRSEALLLTLVSSTAHAWTMGSSGRMLLAMAAPARAWTTVSSGYASSAIDVYVSGGSTEMFNGVSSGGSSYTPPAAPEKTCATRSVSDCETTALYDDDGSYCELDNNACVDLPYAQPCASGASVTGTSIDLTPFPDIPSNLFDGGYIRLPHELHGYPAYASTEASPATLLYYGGCAALGEPSWLLHLTFADPKDSAALAADVAECPHMVQLPGRRLPGPARARNAVAASVDSVSTRPSDVEVACFDVAPPCEDSLVLAGAKVDSADGSPLQLFDGAYAATDATVNFVPLLERRGELLTWYAFYCPRVSVWMVGGAADVDAARNGGCAGHVAWTGSAVSVSTGDGFVASDAQLLCAAPAACEHAVRVAGTHLEWTSAGGAPLSTGFLEGVFERTGATTPDGSPVYASRLVDDLELMRCDNRWRISYAHDEADPCGAATVLGYVGSPDLSEHASVFSNRDEASCTGEPCLFDVDAGARATCLEAFAVASCGDAPSVTLEGAGELSVAYETSGPVNGEASYASEAGGLIYYCPQQEAWVVAAPDDGINTDTCARLLKLSDSVLGANDARQIWYRWNGEADELLAATATCDGAPSPKPTPAPVPSDERTPAPVPESDAAARLGAGVLAAAAVAALLL